MQDPKFGYQKRDGERDEKYFCFLSSSTFVLHSTFLDHDLRPPVLLLLLLLPDRFNFHTYKQTYRTERKTETWEKIRKKSSTCAGLAYRHKKMQVEKRRITKWNMNRQFDLVLAAPSTKIRIITIWMYVVPKICLRCC
jgi:hypothetical protein